MKALFQFLVLVALFFSTWFLLSKIPFVEKLEVSKTSKNLEAQLGDIIYQSISKTEKEETDSLVLTKLNDIKFLLCSKNNIEDTAIKIHLIKSAEINAFALPGGHLVINTALVKDCDSPEELCGVMGHEIAHMQHNHVMKKLLKEVGLAMLTSVASGSGGGEALKQVVKTLSSSAYDRKLESDADKTSVQYMLKADINPQPFADFLFRLSESIDAKNIPQQLYWISDHPESAARAKVLTDYIATQKVVKRNIMDNEDWENMKATVGGM